MKKRAKESTPVDEKQVHFTPDDGDAACGLPRVRYVTNIPGYVTCPKCAVKARVT